MEKLLAQAGAAADEAEVFYTSSEETQVRFEANRLKQLQTKQQTSVALRIVKDGRIGYATATDIGDERLVDNALETARFGTAAGFQFPGALTYPDVPVYDKAVNDVPIEKMIALGEQMITAVTGHTPGIICEAGVSRDTVALTIINSRGARAEYSKSYFSLDVEGSIVNDTDMLFVGEGDISCRPLLDPAEVTAAVLWQLEMAQRRATAPSRLLPVVFTPNGVASALVMPLMAAFNGKTVLQGASPVGDKISEQLFDKRFNLDDDPTGPFCPASRPCDDEGIPSQRTPLIDNGVVSSFLYDLQTAAQAGKTSTGNGGRSRGGLPSPSPSAFIIGAGAACFEEMLKDMKEGLVVEQVMGASQGNVLGGDFSGNVLLGFKVENGEIVGRVKDTMISGNIYQAFKDIAALGREPRWVNGFLRTPHIYLPSLSVASKG